MTPLLGFPRLSVWKNIKRVRDKQIPGDLKGEGRLLGGKLKRIGSECPQFKSASCLVFMTFV